MKGIVYGGLLSVVFVLSGCSGSQKEGRDSKEIPVEIVKVAKTVPADTCLLYTSPSPRDCS